MDKKYLAEIKELFTAEMLPDDYRHMRTSDIAKLRLSGKKLLVEVERLTNESCALKYHLNHEKSIKHQIMEFSKEQGKQIATLKKALELACVAYSAEKVPKNYDRKKHKYFDEAWAEYFIRQAQEQESENDG